MKSNSAASRSPVTAALAAILALGATACGGPSTPPQEAAAPAPAAETATAPMPGAATAADDAAAAIAAREQELQAKQIELELREREIADREAATAKAAPPPKPAATPKPTASAPAAPAAAPPPPPPPVTVPAGTQLSVQLNAPYSTKTTTLGEPVHATLASDLVVEGRRVAKAGAAVSGTVTEVTSGSRKIGAVPALKIDFTQLVVADGSTAAVSIRVAQKGQSEKGRDTAKIAGGAAAGAIIGHQVDDDHGAVIGGVLGGAVGAVGATKTGTEVEVAAGSTVPATVRAAFTYSGQ